MGPETHTYVSSLMAAHQAAAAAAAAAAAHASAKLSPEVELTTKTLKPGMVGIRSDLIGLGGGLPGGAPPPPPERTRFHRPLGLVMENLHGDDLKFRF